MQDEWKETRDRVLEILAALPEVSSADVLFLITSLLAVLQKLNEVHAANRIPQNKNHQEDTTRIKRLEHELEEANSVLRWNKLGKYNHPG